MLSALESSVACATAHRVHVAEIRQECGLGRGGLVGAAGRRGGRGWHIRAGGIWRRLGEAEPPALSPQQSLLLKVKTRLHDPLDSLASWTPWFGPCDEGGDSFEDGWEFVKCDGGTATQLYESTRPRSPLHPRPP